MRKNKKGFTIVELVIVIAVIGVLAAVLIPTFTVVIRKANDSACTQALENGMKQWMTEDNNLGGDTAVEADFEDAYYYYYPTSKRGKDIENLQGIWQKDGENWKQMKAGAAGADGIIENGATDYIPYYTYTLAETFEGEATYYTLDTTGRVGTQVTIADAEAFAASVYALYIRGAAVTSEGVGIYVAVSGE